MRRGLFLFHTQMYSIRVYSGGSSPALLLVFLHWLRRTGVCCCWYEMFAWLPSAMCLPPNNLNELWWLPGSIGGGNMPEIVVVVGLALPAGRFKRRQLGLGVCVAGSSSGRGHWAVRVVVPGLVYCPLDTFKSR